MPRKEVKQFDVFGEHTSVEEEVPEEGPDAPDPDSPPPTEEVDEEEYRRKLSELRYFQRGLTERAFTHKLWECPQPWVERANEVEGNTYARRYMEAEEAIEKIREQETANDDRLLSWVHHPDERVPSYLLRQGRNKDYMDDYSKRRLIQRQLYKRAVRDAEQEGLYWTKLLDRLSSTNHWPHIYGQEVPSPKDLVAPLKPWVIEQTDPREVESLFDFATSAIQRLAIRHISCPDQQFVKRVLKDFKYKVDDLALNPNLAPDQVRFLTDWILEQVHLSPTNQDPTQIPTSDVLSTAERLLEGLRAGPHEIDLPVEGLKRNLRRLTGVDTSRRNHKRTRNTALGFLVDLPEVNSRDIRAAYRQLDVEEDEAQVRSLIRSEEATPELWRQVLQDSNKFTYRETISEQKEALRDPEIRQLLAATTSGKVLSRVIKHSTEEELEEMLQHLVRHDPMRVVYLIDSETLEAEAVDLDQWLREAVERGRSENPEQLYQKFSSPNDRWERALEPRSEWCEMIFRELAHQNPGKAQRVMSEDKAWMDDMELSTQEAKRLTLQGIARTKPTRAIRKMENQHGAWVRAFEDFAPEYRRAFRHLPGSKRYGGVGRATEFLRNWSRYGQEGTASWVAHLGPEDFLPLIREMAAHKITDLADWVPQILENKKVIKKMCKRLSERRYLREFKEFAAQVPDKHLGIVVDAMMDKNIKRTFSWLADEDPERLTRLNREHITRGMHHEDGEVRSIAIRLSAKVEEDRSTSTKGRTP